MGRGWVAFVCTVITVLPRVWWQQWCLEWKSKKGWSKDAGFLAMTTHSEKDEPPPFYKLRWWTSLMEHLYKPLGDIIPILLSKILSWENFSLTPTETLPVEYVSHIPQILTVSKMLLWDKTSFCMPSVPPPNFPACASYIYAALIRNH